MIAGKEKRKNQKKEHNANLAASSLSESQGKASSSSDHYRTKPVFTHLCPHSLQANLNSEFLPRRLFLLRPTHMDIGPFCLWGFVFRFWCCFFLAAVTSRVKSVLGVRSWTQEGCIQEVVKVLKTSQDKIHKIQVQRCQKWPSTFFARRASDWHSPIYFLRNKTMKKNSIANNRKDSIIVNQAQTG